MDDKLFLSVFIRSPNTHYLDSHFKNDFIKRLYTNKISHPHHIRNNSKILGKHFNGTK
jgi:hypothetical protein